MAVVLIGGLWWAFGERDGGSTVHRRSSPPGQAYVGSRACARCHPGEAAHYSRSGHAHTLRKAGDIELARWLDGRSVADPEYPDATWTFHHEAQSLFADRDDRPAGRNERLELIYAFGSGTHATTFVSLLPTTSDAPPLGFEHRMTYFARDTRLDVTPGQLESTGNSGRTPLGRNLSAFETRVCFDCHATRISRQGRERLEPADLLPNVSCERCHGPGQRHLDAVRAGSTDLAVDFAPGRWKAESQMRLCGGCHRLPEVVPTAELRPDNPVLLRFQTVGLMQSRCYREGGGALSCTTCHDPHAPGYENACLSCHDGPAHTPCALGETTGCLPCHMPVRESGHGMRFSDHWIRRNP
jgi:hypothetical protein